LVPGIARIFKFYESSMYWLADHLPKISTFLADGCFAPLFRTAVALLGWSLDSIIVPCYQGLVVLVMTGWQIVCDFTRWSRAHNAMLREFVHRQIVRFGSVVAQQWRAAVLPIIAILRRRIMKTFATIRTIAAGVVSQIVNVVYQLSGIVAVVRSRIWTIISPIFAQLSGLAKVGYELTTVHVAELRRAIAAYAAAARTDAFTAAKTLREAIRVVIASLSAALGRVPAVHVDSSPSPSPAPSPAAHAAASSAIASASAQ